MKSIPRYLLIGILSLVCFSGSSQTLFNSIEDVLPAPNSFRLATGEPGPDYFQQQVDYKIEVELDEKDYSITGSETITYHNNSPSTLDFLWLQLDQNTRAEDAERYLIAQSELSDVPTKKELEKAIGTPFDSDLKIQNIQDSEGRSLDHYINGTLMRVLPVEPISPGSTYSFSLDWSYRINDVNKVEGRSGYEIFEKDGNGVFCIAQFFPRLALFDDLGGWEIRQFFGRSEFGLEFGNYDVSITVPADHIVGATGELQNPDDVLGEEQFAKYAKAKDSEERIFIVSEEDALQKIRKSSKKNKTWMFKAEMVRDFAFASSRRFIWEGKAVPLGGRKIFAHSMYPPEANPLWEIYVTDAIAHTLISHSERTFDYPYSHALAVHLNRAGMEHPMICFNGRRPKPDGSYSEYQKNRLVSLIIHEIGHNYFPMIVNSNERASAWMDEGLNVFLEYHAEKKLDPNYPSRRGTPGSIKRYMSFDPKDVSPIMTRPEIVKNLSYNAYWKTSAALNILRDEVLGPENFDFAFKTYANRWKFKHPSPADFFRTMENASGTDLGWFWRSWFFSTAHVDISLNSVDRFLIKGNKFFRATARNLSSQNENFDALIPMEESDVIREFRNSWKKDWNRPFPDNLNLYALEIENIGGIPMPVSLKMQYGDGSFENLRLPAEIWAKENATFKKLIGSEKHIISFEIDPEKRSSDLDHENNFWPRTGTVLEEKNEID